MSASQAEGAGGAVVERARKLAAQQLGSAVAEKATDEFCLSYAAPAPSPGAADFAAMRFQQPGLEEVALPQARGLQQAVLELRVSDEASNWAAAEAEAAAGALGGGATAAAIGETLQALGEEAAPAERALSLFAREAAIRSRRDRFYHELGGLRDYVERSSSTFAARAEGAPRLGIAAASVQACWLNDTIRAETDASAIADIATDPAVEKIDVPRKIEVEDLDVTIQDAAALRQRDGLGGAGVHVGVIDSEVQLDHPGLLGRVVHRRNYTREPFGTAGSHGTAVAGLIAASGEDFSGMAPEAQIYNYKVLATQTALNGTEFEGYLAIQHALEDGMRVVNCSWGNGPARDGRGREARACDTAWALGMTIVKSAGNNGPGSETLTTPADADGILVVGASTTDGKAVPDYSSRGPTPDGKQRPHLLAPGGDSNGTIDGLLVGGRTGMLAGSGTSFAAPHVTGLIALLLEREPHLRPDQQRDRIIATCQSLSGVDVVAQGAGLVHPTSL